MAALNPTSVHRFTYRTAPPRCLLCGLCVYLAIKKRNTIVTPLLWWQRFVVVARRCYVVIWSSVKLVKNYSSLTALLNYGSSIIGYWAYVTTQPTRKFWFSWSVLLLNSPHSCIFHLAEISYPNLLYRCTVQLSLLLRAVEQDYITIMCTTWLGLALAIESGWIAKIVQNFKFSPKYNHFTILRQKEQQERRTVIVANEKRWWCL